MFWQNIGLLLEAKSLTQWMKYTNIEKVSVFVSHLVGSCQSETKYRMSSQCVNYVYYLEV